MARILSLERFLQPFNEEVGSMYENAVLTDERNKVDG
jgi:hypothetical protein